MISLRAPHADVVLPPRHVDVWWLRIPPFGNYEAILSVEEKITASKFNRDVDRKHYVAAHGGLRILLGRYMRTEPAAIVINREKCRRCGGLHGKPVVTTNPPLHFSMAHTTGLALYGLSQHRIGIDVEREDAIEDSAVIVPHLTWTERLSLSKLVTREQVRAALRCWVRKEALTKGTGDGLTRDFTTIELGVDFAPSPLPIVAVDGWRIMDLPRLDGFVASVAVASDVGPQISCAPLSVPTPFTGT